MLSVGFYVLYQSARVYEWDGERWWIWTGYKWVESDNPAGPDDRIIFLGSRP